MPIPTIIRSTDPGAPVLNGLAGSGYQVMKHALIMCGWTLEYDDPENFKCVFRNNPTSGSGCYVRVFDGPNSHAYGARVMSFFLYEDMIDIDTGSGPHALEGGNNFKKSHTLDNVSRPWVIIGDDRTIYFNVSNTGAPSGSPDQLTMFGDFHSRFPSIMRSVQSLSTMGSTNSNYLGLSSLLLCGSNTEYNVQFSRSVSTQLQTPTPGTIGWNIPNFATGTYNCLGGAGQLTRPSYVNSYDFVSPEIKPPTSQFTYGSLRGMLLPINDMRSFESGSTLTIQGESTVFDVMIVKSNSGAGSSTSSSNATGTTAIIIDRDWDDDAL